jgi:hypothetical protein
VLGVLSLAGDRGPQADAPRARSARRWTTPAASGSASGTRRTGVCRSTTGRPSGRAAGLPWAAELAVLRQRAGRPVRPACTSARPPVAGGTRSTLPLPARPLHAAPSPPCRDRPPSRGRPAPGALAGPLAARYVIRWATSWRDASMVRPSPAGPESGLRDPPDAYARTVEN